jgi:S1-C subfamily serine protease
MGHGLPLGLAVPAATAREAAAQLRLHGGIMRGWLGVFIHTVSPSGMRQGPEGFPDGSLALAVDYVVPGSPADQAGVRAGDAILRFAGSPIFSTAALRKQIARTALNAEIAVTLVRGEGVEQAKIVIGPQPATPPQLPGEKEWGLRLLSHLLSEPSESPNEDGQSSVIVQHVETRSRACGLSPRDVILSVNEVATPNLEIFCREVGRLCATHAANRVRLLVSSKGNPHEVVLGGE